MNAPALSVILVAPDGYGEVAATLRHLRAQTIAGRLELVIVAPEADHFQVRDEDATAFGQVTVVAVSEVKTLAMARAAGVLRRWPLRVTTGASFPGWRVGSRTG